MESCGYHLPYGMPDKCCEVRQGILGALNTALPLACVEQLLIVYVTSRRVNALTNTVEELCC